MTVGADKMTVLISWGLVVWKYLKLGEVFEMPKHKEPEEKLSTKDV